jgi:hypothetical protein
MTVDALTGPVERPLDPAVESIAIGAPDSNIFLCPSCNRPLAVGVNRCTSCRARLVNGIQLGKASGFVVLGLVVGMVVGGGLVGTLALLSQPSAAIAGRGPGTTTPGASGAPGQPNPAAAAVPPAALSALRQSIVINQRLLGDADQLARALKRTNPAAEEIAPLLRSMSSTASFGDRIAPTVRSWEAGDAVGKSLASFYRSIARVASDALSASLANDRAYADAGRRMLAVMDKVVDLDAASRGLAATVGTELPPLIPGR